MTDSTPMIAWLETEFPEPSVMPADPATRFLSLLVEDFADEWLWRPAMHYRWSYADDRFVLGNRLGREILGAGTRCRRPPRRTFFQQRQLGIFIRGDGIDRHDPTARRRGLLPGLDLLQADLRRAPLSCWANGPRSPTSASWARCSATSPRTPPLRT